MDDFSGFFEYKGHNDDAYGRCTGCDWCKPVTAFGGWTFPACFHAPYHGKWTVEIKDCPIDTDKQPQFTVNNRC